MVACIGRLHLAVQLQRCCRARVNVMAVISARPSQRCPSREALRLLRLSCSPPTPTLGRELVLDVLPIGPDPLSVQISLNAERRHNLVSVCSVRTRYLQARRPMCTSVAWRGARRTNSLPLPHTRCLE